MDCVCHSQWFHGCKLLRSGCIYIFVISFFFITLLYSCHFRERGWEREIQISMREKHNQSAASYKPPPTPTPAIGDGAGLTRNRTRGPPGAWVQTQSWATLAGPFCTFKERTLFRINWNLLRKIIKVQGIFGCNWRLSYLSSANKMNLSSLGVFAPTLLISEFHSYS